jgi:type VI secretion system protein ImpA
MTVEDWIRDTDVEPPCGPNLEYDEQFMALMASAAGKPEQQFGDTIIPAEAPDWKAVLEQSTDLLARTKDLRATVLLTRALTRVDGLPGFLQGIELTRRLLEAHWEDVHPRLILDGEADPVMRVNALAALADETGLLRDLRAASLISTTVGAITVRSAEAVLKHDVAAAGGMTEAQLAQAAKSAINGNQLTLLAIPAAIDHCRAIQALTVERMGAVDAPDLQPARALLETMGRLVVAPQGDGEAKGAAGTAVASSLEAAPFGALRTRQDALRALDEVCDFLARSEPSNPAPLLIRRAQRLIGSDFLDIMRDMAPDSLAQIEAIAGIKGTAASGEGSS